MPALTITDRTLFRHIHDEAWKRSSQAQLESTSINEHLSDNRECEGVLGQFGSISPEDFINDYVMYVDLM